MRVAIVNDLRLASEALRRVVESQPGFEVAWIAADGEEAVRRTISDRPDLILMDLIMPRLDGVEATRQIMAKAPCPILVVTSSVSGNISRVYEAMGVGALDAVDTPILGAAGRPEGASALLQKMGTVRRLVGVSGKAASRPEADGTAWSPMPGGSAARQAVPPDERWLPRLVVLGASTGGPKVLSQVLAGLPSPFPGIVVVVQHVDAAFASGMADWLAERSGRPVRVVEPGRPLQAGSILVARTNDHLLMTADRRLGYSAEPVGVCYRPSVDVFLRSVARHWPDPGIAVLLTGMGRDGAEGLLELRRKGWTTVAQDRESSTVWGMPRAAVEIGAAAHEMNPRQIVDAIQAWTRPTTSQRNAT